MRVVKLYWYVIICFPILTDRHMCCSSVENKTELFVDKTAVNSNALVDSYLIKHFFLKKLAYFLLILYIVMRLSLQHTGYIHH